MAITPPTDAEFAAFLGIEVTALSPYKAEALSQAQDLMQIALPCITADPTDAFEKRVLLRGIMSMAEALILGQPARAAAALPYKSETIGSYGYTIRDLHRVALAGEPTGIGWFDQAVSYFDCSSEEGDSETDSVSVFERDVYYGIEDGRRYVIGPADVNAMEPTGID